jgi:hypothetical protein
MVGFSERKTAIAFHHPGAVLAASTFRLRTRGGPRPCTCLLLLAVLCVVCLCVTNLIRSCRDATSSDVNGIIMMYQSLPPVSTSTAEEQSMSKSSSKSLQFSAMERALAAAVAEAASSHEKIKELSVLMGCHSSSNNNSADWRSDSDSGNCLQAVANRMQSQRTADEAAETTLRERLRNRRKSNNNETDTDTDTDMYSNIDLIDHHPALVPMIPEYEPKPEWIGVGNINILPDIAIVGLPKAGTSQLFYILTHHPAATPFHAVNANANNNGTGTGGGEKEYCPRLPARFLKQPHHWWTKASSNDGRRVQLQKSLYEWHKTLYQQYRKRNRNRNNDNDKQQPQMTVNACLNNQELWLSLHYLNSTGASHDSLGAQTSPSSPSAPAPERKYVVLLRDPADWLWAVWNFWVDAGLDSKIDTAGSWAVRGSHYRSPELFHELILSADQTVAGDRLVHQLRRDIITTHRRLVALVGRDNVLFLRNEDMLPAVVEKQGGLLDQLSTFSGLDRSLFRDDGLRTIHNCNDMKGEKSKCGNRTNSAYEIAGHREMLESTRSLIYLHYQPECQIWKEEFGVTYPDCLNAAATVGTE